MTPWELYNESAQLDCGPFEGFVAGGWPV
jgi:hypothetical protein